MFVLHVVGISAAASPSTTQLGVQPMEEPEDAGEFVSLLAMFSDVIGPDHLMFSSDYPHRDSASPYESVPSYLPEDVRRKILGENASTLYGIPLPAGTGVRTAGRS